MAKPKESTITALIDTREQWPLDLGHYGLATKIGTLQHGDYSLMVPDMRRHCAIERKSLADFCACCGVERDRFERELLALRGYRYRAVVIEADFVQITGHDYRSRITPQAVAASIARWSVGYNIPIVFTGDHDGAARFVADCLRLVAHDVIEYARIALGADWGQGVGKETGDSIAMSGRAVSDRLAKV